MNYTVKLPSGARLTMCQPGTSEGAEVQREELRTRGRWQMLQIDPAYYTRKKQSWYTKKVRELASAKG